MKSITKSLIVSFILSFSCVSSAEIAVIVNPSNSENLTQADIKRIFLGKMKSYSNGSKIVPFNQNKSSNIKPLFDSTVLGKSPGQMKAYWSKILFSGKGKPPKAVPDDQAVLNAVISESAAIGYVDSANITDKVKVIARF